MRIAIAAHQAGRDMTGLARYIIGLVTALVHTAPDHDYRIVLASGLPGDHPLENLAGPRVDVARVPLRSGLSLRQHWVVPRIVREFAPDVFHHPHLDLPLLAPRPAVATIHDLKYVRHPEFFPGLAPQKRFVLTRLMKRTADRADALIAVSEHTRRDLCAAFGTPPDKVHVVHHGVEAPPEGTAAPEGPYLLFVGERRPHKNLPRLIRAFARFRETHPGYRLVVAGKAYADYREPERVADELGLGTAIEFTGPLPDDALGAAYRHAEALALPSLYEGFGFPVVEAMGLGVPVIASETTSLTEVAGDAALLVDPTDVDAIAGALGRVIDDPRARAGLVERGRARAAEFTWDRAARETLAVYERVVRVQA